MTAVAARKRGPYAPSRRRRAGIADAVLAVVDEVGPDGVTVALVAERSGSGEATVLYHFPTKDHLLVAALERSDELSAHSAHIDRPAAEIDVDIDLDALARPGSENAHRRRLLIMLTGQAAVPGHPAREYLQRRANRTIDIFTRLVERQQEQGKAHPGIDARTAACEFLALMEGLDSLEMLEVPIDRSRATVEAFRRLTGTDWMEVRARLLGDDLGI